MGKTRHYEFEGLALEIPLRYDEQSHLYIEEYPDFVNDPVYTPAGCPVLFIGEDACPHAEAADGGGCPDCGSCRFFRPAGIHTWIGVCGHEKRRRAARPDQAGKHERGGPSMAETPVCEITLTGTEGREWQGTVYFPASGERQSFRSLLELVLEVERETRRSAEP